jgi:hypothetical protein
MSVSCAGAEQYGQHGGKKYSAQPDSTVLGVLTILDVLMSGLLDNPFPHHRTHAAHAA